MTVQQAIKDDFRVTYYRCVGSSHWGPCRWLGSSHWVHLAQLRGVLVMQRLCDDSTCRKLVAFAIVPGRELVLTCCCCCCCCRGYLDNLCKAVSEGVKVTTYFAWSFMDNFE
jgi:hypothetical protein